MAVRTFRLFVPAAVLLLALAGAAPAVGQTFDEAFAAHERGDFATAYRGFRRLAEQDDASAQFNLGLMYYFGRGVPKSHAEAVKWYRRAATQGVAEAQSDLGVMYQNGWGVRQDDAAAVEWYRRAAAQDDALAHFNLGGMYFQGRGVPQSYGEAAKRYRSAAAQGFAVAQFNLAIMYEYGRGVPRDLVQAHKWYDLAAARLSNSIQRARTIRSRDRVAARLTPEGLARAQRLARTWRPDKAKGLPPLRRIGQLPIM